MNSHRLLRGMLTGALGLIFLFVSATHAQDAVPQRTVRLSRADGQVLVAHPGSDSWENAPVNLPLQEGDTLATQAGRAELEFENGAIGYLAENSVLQLAQLDFAGGGRVTLLDLTQGAGTFYANLTSQDSFRVRTPTFDVSIFDRAEFRVDVFSDGAAAQVLQGYVYVSTSASSIKLEKGQSVSLNQADYNGLGSVAGLPQEDSFDQWVNDEGEMIRSGDKAALNYVSASSDYGLSDLAIYGTWINLPGYGYGWRPFRVGLTWAPYVNGSWRLNPRFGWVWISGEPWGWTPYHFGSWLLSPTAGWVWVPGGSEGLRHWQPACVNWVQVGNRVGWVPKSPDDREGSPANLAHGIITRGYESSRGETLTNEIVKSRDFRNVTSLKQPPADFVSHLQPGPARAEAPSTGTTRVAGVRVPVQPVHAMHAGGSIVFDRGTHTFINGNEAPTTESRGNEQRPHVAPAALMPTVTNRGEVPREVPRVGAPPSRVAPRATDRAIPQIPQANRVMPAHSYPPVSVWHQPPPSSVAAPATAPTNQPPAPTRVCAPPTTMRGPSPPTAPPAPANSSLPPAATPAPTRVPAGSSAPIQRR